MLYGVWAEPPSKGLYADLKPRFQMYNTGVIVTYETEEEAEEQARECRKDRNGWTYTVRPITPHLTGRTE